MLDFSKLFARPGIPLRAEGGKKLPWDSLIHSQILRHFFNAVDDLIMKTW